MSDKIIRFFRATCTALAVLCLPTIALAQTGNVSQEPWYKVVTGIIAILVALLGLVASYRLLRKTNLEARKLELEILEKQEKFQAAPESEGLQALKEFAEPIGTSQRFLILIMRFLILDLTLRLWGFIPFAVKRIFSIATTSFLLVVGPQWYPTSLTSVSGATFYILPIVLEVFFDVVQWSIIFGFGWPLLKDVGKIMGISLSNIFDLPVLWKHKRRDRSAS